MRVQGMVLAVLLQDGKVVYNFETAFNDINFYSDNSILCPFARQRRLVSGET